MSDFLTKKEAAKMLNISVVTLDTYVKEGKIRRVELSRRKIFFVRQHLLEDVDKLEKTKEKHAIQSN